MLHHCPVFLRASSTKLSFWINLTASCLEDLLSMEQLTNFFLESADAHAQSRFPLAFKVILCATSFPEPSDVALLRIPVRTTILIAAVSRKIRSSSVHALTQNNIENLYFFFRPHSASWNASSKYPYTFNTGWSVSFPAKYAEQSCAVSCRPCLKEFPDLQDFRVICNFTESIKFFVCLFVRSFDNSLFYLLVRK